MLYRKNKKLYKMFTMKTQSPLGNIHDYGCSPDSISEFCNCLDWSFSNGELLNIMDVSIQTLKTNHLGRFQIKSL